MFKSFLKDSFFYAKRYYGYIFGLLVVSFIMIFLSLILLGIVAILLAVLTGTDLSNISYLSDKNILPFLGGRLILFIVLMVILFLVWTFLMVTFVQYPLTKTCIEITRDKEEYKRPFSIFFEKVKEKNILMAFKMFGLGFLIFLIMAPVFIIACIAVAQGMNVTNTTLRLFVLLLGVIGFALTVYILLRLMFANQALVDKDLGVIESMKESLKLTRGKMGFVILAILYSTVVSAIFQAPIYLLDALNKAGIIEENMFFSLLSIAFYVLYLLVMPYFIVLQYLPYNVLRDYKEKEDEGYLKTEF